MFEIVHDERKPFLPMMSTVLRNRVKSQRRNVSAEEVECIAGLVDDLVQTGVNWIDEGEKHTIHRAHSRGSPT